ncbi:uncharacterized protein [Henckelia pumila]|uniref:uncharacterized protein n=1 Tax=Henckelia pumila TaxID=405737 RepID=UPI003C6DBD3C
MGSQFAMAAPPYSFSPQQPPVIPSNKSRTTDSYKESATPSPIPSSQFPTFSTQVGLDNIVLDKDNEMDGKRAPWSVDEEKLLARWSNEDILVKAHEIWKTNNNTKPFKHEHVWRILKECEKYAPRHHHANKKARTSESEGHTTSSNPDTSIDVDDCEVRIRPMGQKAAKRKGKMKAVNVEKWEKKMDLRWQKLEELHMEKIELQKNEVATREAEALHKDYEILMKDTSDITPEQLNIHLKICAKLKRKHGIE